MGNCRGSKRQYPFEFVLKQHQEAQHPEYFNEKLARKVQRKYTCPENDCIKMFMCRKNLRTHIMNCHGTERFKCEFPGCMSKSFKTKKRLRDHRRYHDILEITCDLCGIKKRNKSSMRYHFHSSHPIPETIECAECGVIKLNRPAYHRHMARHKNTSTSINVKLEISLTKLFHLILEHTCPICQKAYRKRNLLQFHHHFEHVLNLKKTQQYEKVFGIYVCPKPMCTSQFKDLLSIKKHIYKYHDKVEKTYYLCECSKAFDNMKEFKVHLMKGITRTFTCPRCDAQFNLPCLLEKHTTKDHSNNEPFRCKHCILKFDNLEAYKEHVAQKHL